MTAINVFQRTWAFTDKDSKKPIIKTGSFGPCCVVTFASGPYAALTHLDMKTNVHSLTSIFNKFKNHGVEFKDIKVVILGGWKADKISEMFCQMVICKLNMDGFENVSIKNMFSKEVLSSELTNVPLSNSQAIPHYHFGALIEAKTGNTFILTEPQSTLDVEQRRQTAEFRKKNLTELQAISQVT